MFEEALVLEDPYAEEPKVKQALYSLLTDIKTFSKNKSYPAGLNVEITNALLGVNIKKYAYLPMSSLRINENGELIDQYGTPYWFHSQASNDLKITSAGIDKVFHTEDDESFPEH